MSAEPLPILDAVPARELSREPLPIVIHALKTNGSLASLLSAVAVAPPEFVENLRVNVNPQVTGAIDCGPYDGPESRP